MLGCGNTAPEVLLAIYAYAVQIFADFAGYSTIAIGVALLLGFRFPDNFNSPYRATSVQDFWRRWHMTLSRWLRDYLYIPLGGNRGSRFETERNLMLTMVIGGLWHGANWTFLFWGALHGSALIVERLARGRRTAAGKPPMRKWLAWLITFNFVCFAWIFFRAETFGQALGVIERLFTGWGRVRRRSRSAFSPPSRPGSGFSSCRSTSGPISKPALVASPTTRRAPQPASC